MTLAFLSVARAVAVAVLLSAWGAQAQTIYRCGNEYTRIPCANGWPLEIGDARSAAQRAEARTLLMQERRQASEMEAARRRQEAALLPAGPARLGPRPAEPAASAAAKGKKSTPTPTAKTATAAKKKGLRRANEDGDFIAGVPPAPKAKKSAGP